jgi:hypothetical protein
VVISSGRTGILHVFQGKLDRFLCIWIPVVWYMGEDAVLRGVGWAVREQDEGQGKEERVMSWNIVTMLYFSSSSMFLEFLDIVDFVLYIVLCCTFFYLNFTFILLGKSVQNKFLFSMTA